MRAHCLSCMCTHCIACAHIVLHVHTLSCMRAHTVLTYRMCMCAEQPDSSGRWRRRCSCSARIACILPAFSSMPPKTPRSFFICVSLYVSLYVCPCMCPYMCVLVCVLVYGSLYVCPRMCVLICVSSMPPKILRPLCVSLYVCPYMCVFMSLCASPKKLQSLYMCFLICVPLYVCLLDATKILKVSLPMQKGARHRGIEA